MDIFERFNSKFGQWYEGLFGGEGGELRPKDVLRKLIAAMEDNRKEGLDGKIYVPNKYILELAVSDSEEREYLLSFLDEEELVGVLQKFMAQNNYKTRGPLDFTIADVPEADRETRTEKLRVKVRYEKADKDALPLSPPLPLFSPNPSPASGEGMGWGHSDDLPTVASVNYEDDEPGTVPAVAWAALAITNPEGRKSHFSLTKPIAQIGRSRNADNDLILDTDGMVSKAHARLERERDGSWTLYDLGSTNGVKVGTVRVESNRILTDGDEIQIGETKLVFQQADVRPAAASPAPAAPAASSAPPRRARLLSADGEAFVLASETLIGRAVTSDIILPDSSVATKHARVVAPDASTYFLEDLAGHSETRVNDRVLFPGQRLLLTSGDVLSFGTVQMRFVAGSAL
ncbi:MAG: FhaA domain-containing protein [Janthinobacterium lividum]